MPLTAAGFQSQFKIQNFDRSPADNYFPASHTCFFTIDLPRYSSVQVMKDKLRYAIFNCEAIDTDGSVVQASAAAAAEEDEDEENVL